MLLYMGPYKIHVLLQCIECQRSAKLRCGQPYSVYVRLDLSLEAIWLASKAHSTATGRIESDGMACGLPCLSTSRLPWPTKYKLAPIPACRAERLLVSYQIHHILTNPRAAFRKQEGGRTRTRYLSLYRYDSMAKHWPSIYGRHHPTRQIGQKSCDCSLVSR